MQTKTFAAFAGIRNTLPDERLERAVRQSGSRDPRIELTSATNVDIDDSGAISRRAGQTVILPGAAHSLWSNEELCFFVQGGALTRLMPDRTRAIIESNVGDAPMKFVEKNGIVYWSNSERTGMIIDGVSQSWGMPAPTYQPNAAPISGQLASGSYLYAMTFVRDDGQESGTGLSVVVNLDDGAGLRFAWPAPADARIAEVVIYMSEPNGEVMYEAVRAPARAGTIDVTTTKGATPLNTQWLDAPMPGHVLAYHRGRIYIADGAHLFATSALGFSYVDMRDYLALDGTRISFVVGVEHGLYVATGKAVYFLKGDRFDTMEIEEVAEGFGVEGSAIITDGFIATADEKLAGVSVAIFATEFGVYLGTETGQVSNLTRSRFQTTMPRSGAAVLRASQTLTQYLLTMHA